MVYVTLNCVHIDLLLQLTSCTEQIVQLMQERDILQDANNQMNEVSARKLKVSLNVSLCTIQIYQFFQQGMQEGTLIWFCGCGTGVHCTNIF